MLNKRLVRAVPESRKYIAGNVLCQWVSLLANIRLMAALPPVYFLLLGILVAGYMLLVTAVKKLYVRRYGQWL